MNEPSGDVNVEMGFNVDWVVDGSDLSGRCALQIQ